MSEQRINGEDERPAPQPVRIGRGFGAGWAREALDCALCTDGSLVGAILDAVPHGVYWKDLRSVYTGCNRAFASLVGLGSAREVVGRSDFDLALTPEGATRRRAADQEVLDTGAASLDREEVLELAGRSRTVLVSRVPLRRANGALEGLVGVIADITGQRHAEERWELAVRGAGDGIVDWDLRTNELYRSPRWLEMLGYADGELTGGTEEGMALIHPDDLPALLEALGRQLRGETNVSQLEHRVRCKDGRYLWVMNRGQVVARGPDGVALRLVSTQTDISRQKELEETLRQAKAAAEEAARAKSEFLATMSHELRTPMNGVLGFTALLLGTAMTDDQRGFVQTIQRSGEDLLRILNDILDLGKIEAGRLQIEDLPFDLPMSVWEVVALLGPAAREKGIDLLVILEPPAPGWVRGDAGRLRQVLLNLVGNAVKFTSEGCVTVRVEGDAAAGRIRVQVRDTGVGIPADRTATLFSRFNQVDSSTTRRFGGTGLGLAISRQLVTLMGGEIGVTSELGRGSTFSVSLPWRAAEPPARPGPTDGEEPQWRRPVRVLAADDNPTNQLLVKRMMEKLGADVTLAENGLAAVRLFEQGTFDLVLMDCQMPEMDGLEATGRIRQLEAAGARGRIPIIALTASTVAGDRERCLAADMDDYLSKPVRVQDLRSTLGRWAPPLPVPGRDP